jgi:hypothetical protein
MCAFSTKLTFDKANDDKQKKNFLAVKFDLFFHAYLQIIQVSLAGDVL